MEGEQGGGGRRTGRSRQVVLAGIPVAVAGVIVWLAIHNGRVAALPDGGTLSGLAFMTVGALILIHRPHERVGWLVWGIGAAELGNALMGEYARAALAPGAGWPLGGLAAWFEDWLWFPSLGASITLLPLLFPTGRLPSRCWRPVLWLVGLAMALMLAAAVTVLPSVADRTTVGATGGDEVVAELLGGLAFLLVLVAGVASVASVIFRYRAGSSMERLQVKWLLTATSLLVAVFVLGKAIGQDGLAVVELISVLAVPAAIGVAILRHRLWGIDVVISRSLVYLVLTAAVGGAYVGVIAAVDRGVGRSGSEGAILAAAVVAVAFQPLRARVQQGVNRLLFGQRDDPYGLLAALGHRLEATDGEADLLAGVAEGLARALRLPQVRIDLLLDGEERTAASSGGPAADRAGREPGEGGGRATSEVFPLLHRGELVGHLSATPRLGERALSTSDRRLIADVARQVAVAGYAAVRDEDLRRSRERLRSALEDERRRIRRDLHDGLGPSLAALVMGLEQVRNIRRSAPEEGEALLVDLKEQAQDAIAGVRTLVYDLRPPALDDLGLVAALQEQARRSTAAVGADETVVEVSATAELPPLSAAVEVAAFRIVQEAITNVLRHARATRCGVVLDSSAGVLHIQVADDGSGIPADHRAGVGMRSMRERASELGGTVTFADVERGTRLEVDLPLASRNGSLPDRLPA